MPKPIRETIKGLRQRQRSDGSWRVWWEPVAAEKQLGFASVELDADRPAWSIKQATQQNDAIERARRGEPAKVKGGPRTIDALIVDYRKSRHFLDKKPATRRSYTTNLNAIARKWGPHRAADFTKPVMHEWYETLRKNNGPDQALQLTGMMSILMWFAEIRGWRAEGTNPCYQLKRQSSTRRHRHATWAEYDALIDAATALGMPAMACAIALATLCPPRQVDVIETKLADFTWASVDLDGTGPRDLLVWGLTLSKRGNANAKPVHPEAMAHVQAMLDAAPEGQTYLLHDHATHAPFSGDLFRKRWATIRAHAAKTCPSLTAPGKQLQFRDLRRTFGVWARAGGATKNDVGDVLGNSAGTDPVLGEIYMPASFETAARAVFAVERPKPKGRKQA
ncbi:hypothetical protein KZZ08_00670 [Roseovarius mucosus]|uniref:hypothetical protein n=1 Tax=Roseovarius mucosus TaxID=215743 RepID=UPI001C5F71A1|nr:hypothetical protein [Roseovarius mucosus]MBW4972109.1 hypothetical protein [Roseovarius mucosus]